MSREIAQHLLDYLEQKEYTHFSGVPCSLLKGVFKELEAPGVKTTQRVYVPAVREDSALGVASGMYLAGNKSVVLMQNSGLGYSLNVLTSFNLIYSIPILLLVSWRGAYGNDAVEHDVIGANLTALLRSIGILYWEFDANNLQAIVDSAITAMEHSKRPVAVLIKDAI